MFPPHLLGFTTPTGPVARMAPTTPGELAHWIEQQRPKGVTRFTLQKQLEEPRGTIVCDCTWADGQGDSNTLAMMIHGRAVEDARVFPGAWHVYGIFAWVEMAQKDRKYLTIPGAGEVPIHAPPEASAPQMLGQLLQHEAAAVQFSLNHTNEIVGFYREQVVELRTRIRELETQLWGFAKQREEFESKRHEREMQRLEFQSEENQTQRKWEFFMPAGIQALQLVATGARAAMGLPAATGSAPNGQESPSPNGQGSAIEKKISAFLEGLTGGQMEQMQGVLRPDQQLELLEIYQFFATRAEAHKRAANQDQAASQGNGSDGAEPTTH